RVRKEPRGARHPLPPRCPRGRRPRGLRLGPRRQTSLAGSRALDPLALAHGLAAPGLDVRTAKSLWLLPLSFLFGMRERDCTGPGALGMAGGTAAVPSTRMFVIAPQ